VPCLVVDLAEVRENCARLRRVLPEARMYYAVKANPAAEVIRAVWRAGSGFDVAGREEIELCLRQGVPPEVLSYGNTIKKARDIAYAYRAGVRRFVFDSAEDLENLARYAPGSAVSCRILADSPGALTPFGRKFGCAPEMAVELLERAAQVGLDPEGVAFHVGSQHLDPGAWDSAIEVAAWVSRAVAERGVSLRGLNIGGGFPVRYTQEVPPWSAYAAVIRESVARHFAVAPALSFEPGRAVVASAGVLRSEVVTVSPLRTSGGGCFSTSDGTAGLPRRRTRRSRTGW